MAFNYGLVDAPVATIAREAAQRIKLRLRRSTEDIIEIGLDLLKVKKAIGHGNFLPWIEAEFGMSRQTADNFVHVAEIYGTKLPIVGNLSPTALYELAAPKTPIEVREEVERMIEAGEVVTKAVVEELRKQVATAQTSVEHLAERNQELAQKIGAPPEPAVDADAVRAQVEREVEQRLNARSQELAAANVAANDEIKRLREALDSKLVVNVDPPNVVRPSFGAADPEEDDGVDDPASYTESDAIHAFSGALASMDGLTFSPAAFWALKGRKSTSGKAAHASLLAAGATIRLLIKEFSN